MSLGMQTNTLNSASAVTFQVNGINSALSASIPASTGGTQVGGGSPVFLQTGDLVNYNFTTAATSGNAVLRMITTYLTVDKSDPSSDFYT